MSESLQQTIGALELISQIKRKKLRDYVLKDLKHNKHLYKALREVAINIIKKNIALNENQKRKLRKYRSLILQLASKNVKKRKRGKLVQQSGGFLPVLIPLVSAIISNIANGTR